MPPGGTPQNGNLIIWNDAGICSGAVWGGENRLVWDARRPENYTTALYGDDRYHILRLTAVGAGDADRVVKIYLDEEEEAVLTIENALRVTEEGNDYLGFGATLGQATQTLYFDWVTGTNAGAFGPGPDAQDPDDNDEVACIGMSLFGGGDISGPCHDPFADWDEDLDVDQNDFAVFQVCFTGSGAGQVPTDPEYCVCFDQRNDDGQPGRDDDIGPFGLGACEDCASGSDMSGDALCDGG